MSVSKKVNKNGGITIPKLLRGNAGIFAGNAVDIEELQDGIVIKPHTDVCRFCGTVEELIKLNELNLVVCKHCADKIIKVVSDNE